jgi:hypothetical protein
VAKAKPIFNVRSYTFFRVYAEDAEAALYFVRQYTYVDSTYDKRYADDNEPQGKIGMKTAILDYSNKDFYYVKLETRWKVKATDEKEALSFVEDNITSGSKIEQAVFDKEEYQIIGRRNEKYMYF